MINTAQEDIIPHSARCIQALVGILVRVCENPINPSFNHYLFEAIAAMIKVVSTKNPEAATAFQNLLFVSFQKILEKDIQGKE